MKFTWNWLEEFIALDASPAEIAERLTMAGLEVDAVDALGAGLDGVVCAEVVAIEPHPKADRLRVCRVRGADTATLLPIVCGAPNVAVGQRVPLALPGAHLANGTVVATTEIRGVASAGMLCSAAELGVGADADGLLVLPDEAAVGSALAQVLGLDDVVFELSITPNRGDCLSVLGIAREIVALTGARWRERCEGPVDAGADEEPVAITIDDPEACRRYFGQSFHAVTIKASPAWLQARLRAVGLRPINNVVDITNYVMFERGQPLHAFDLERLPAPEIRVRSAKPGEHITTLDGHDRELVEEDLLITSAGTPVAIAGVMGGEDSEVVDATRSILLEAAWFRPESVRRTAKRLALRSEASYRFERGVDLEGVGAAAARAAALLADLAGARPTSSGRDVYPRKHEPVPISVRLARAEALLGVALQQDDVASRLGRFGMAVESESDGVLRVVVPAHRSDVTREIDVVEEVARSMGYEAIPETLPRCDLGGEGLSAAMRQQRDLRRLLAGLGFHEVVPLSFAAPAANRQFPGLQPDRTPVRILNPLTAEDAEMRLSLWPGLLQVAAENLAQGATKFAGFGLGKVYWQQGTSFAERLHVAAIVCGAVEEVGVGARSGAWEFADLKGVVEALFDRFAVPAPEWRRAAADPMLHPGQSAAIVVDGVLVGRVAALHPRCAEDRALRDPVWLFELDLDSLLDYLPQPPVFEELPRFPMVVRDLALVVDAGFESERVVRCVFDRAQSSEWIESVRLTDRYVGPPLPEGKESLTFSIAYRSRARTLTDSEVNETHARLVQSVCEALPVGLR